MNMIKIYLYAPTKKVLLPTVAETEAGVFVEGEPLHIFDHLQVDLWKGEIFKALNREMLTVKTPEGQLEPGSQLLKKKLCCLQCTKVLATSQFIPPDLATTACGLPLK